MVWSRLDIKILWELKPKSFSIDEQNNIQASFPQGWPGVFFYPSLW